MDDGQASTQPAFLTGYRRQRAEITVVAPDKDECPVDARPGERPSQEGCRTTAGMQELEQRRSGCRARATQERLPS
jgi:broad specificity polyphosphatase/5'/3'-nucleotidase SurE